MDFLKAIPSWFFGCAFFFLVCLLVLSLLTGTTFSLNGASYGFNHSPFPVKKFYALKPVSVESANGGQGVDVDLHVLQTDGFCYLTAMSGAFHGSGELVKVSVDNNEYVLHVTSGDSGNHIHAEAQCIMFSFPKPDQR